MSMEIRLYGHGVELRTLYKSQHKYRVHCDGKLVGVFDDVSYAKMFAEGFKAGVSHG